MPTNGNGAPRAIAQAEAGGVIIDEVVDPTRRHAALLSSSSGDEYSLDVFDLSTGTRKHLPLAVTRDVEVALDAGARRIAVASSDADEQHGVLQVLEIESGRDVTPKAIAIGAPPISLAFSPDGNAVLSRTPNALVRIALDGPDTTPRVRFLERASLVHEDVPNWFDADDPKGERPRVLVLDVNGHVTLERVRFDDADVAPIAGKPQDLKAEWQRRLDLQIDGNGRVAPPSGTTGGSF